MRKCGVVGGPTGSLMQGNGRFHALKTVPILQRTVSIPCFNSRTFSFDAARIALSCAQLLLEAKQIKPLKDY